MADTMCDMDALRDWYERYVTAEDVVSFCAPLANEPLQLNSFETNIDLLSKEVQLTDGFCSVCRKVFDNWPSGLRSEMESDQAAQTGTQSDSDSGQAKLVEPLPHFSNYLGWNWVENWGDAITLDARPTTISLGVAARAGCRSCAFFLQSISEAGLLNIFQVIEKRLRILNKPSRVTLVVVKWTETKPAYLLQFSYPGRKIAGFHHEYEDLPDHALRLQVHRLNSSSDSPEHAEHADGDYLGPLARNAEFPLGLEKVLAQAQRWTEECLSSHITCNTDRVTHYPSRLLSIATRPIKLVSTQNWVSKPRYATLSYCWGDTKRHVCLTDENMDALSSVIPDGMLPQTFEDAITVASTVGLEYLWIDSLCIIQGNVHDWEIEASRMASVYGGSSLTIAASSAKDSHRGFLKQDFYGCSSFCVDLKSGSQTETCQFSHSGPYGKFVTQSHLASRGWAVQEKILSPRMLHCGSLGLFWECRTKIASDCWPDGFFQHPIPPPLVWHSPNQEEAYYESDRERWADIRDWYSGCNLTFPSDKLVAFSGIARHIQEQNGDEYMAGLWRNSMPADMCWVVEQPQKRPAYRAPSWSWASVDGRVATRYVEAREDLYAQVHGINIENRADTFGAVNGGSLFLLCRGLVAGQIVEKLKARRSRPHTSWIRGGEYEVYADIGDNKHDFAFDPDTQGGSELNPGDSVYFLALHGGREGTDSTLTDGTHVEDRAVVGIVLKLNGVDGCFTRVGFFRFPYLVEPWASQELVDDYHPFLQRLSDSAELSLKLAFEVVSNKGSDTNRYVIKIS